MLSRYAFGCEGICGLDECQPRVPAIWRVKIPQRRHSVCVLLWRLPKELVPFAVYCVSLIHALYGH